MSIVGNSPDAGRPGGIVIVANAATFPDGGNYPSPSGPEFSVSGDTTGIVHSLAPVALSAPSGWPNNPGICTMPLGQNYSLAACLNFDGTATVAPAVVPTEAVALSQIRNLNALQSVDAGACIPGASIVYRADGGLGC